MTLLREGPDFPHLEVVNRAVYPKVRRSYTAEFGGMLFPASGET